MFFKSGKIILGLLLVIPSGLYAETTRDIVYPTTLQVRARSISENNVGSNEKIVVFEGEVEFDLQSSITIKSDKMVVGFNKDYHVRYFELKGNVIMKKGDLRISSKSAYTENLHHHIDFLGETTIFKDDITTKFFNMRYDFLTNSFEPF